MRRVTAIVTVTTALLAASAFASWDGSADVSVQSAYLWRGMVVNDEPVLQPSLTVSRGGFSGGVWVSADLTGAAGHRLETTEVDAWLAWTGELEHFDVTLTAYEYTYPHDPAPSTRELWAGVTWKTFGSPALTVVRDVGEAGGTYVLLSGTRALGLLDGPASEGLVLTLNLGRGNGRYTRFYFPGLEAGHAADYGARLSWPAPLGPGTLEITLQYSAFIGGTARGPGFEGHPARLSGGLAYSLPFEL